jgi:hypothetical protein
MLLKSAVGFFLVVYGVDLCMVMAKNVAGVNPAGLSETGGHDSDVWVFVLVAV